MPPGKRLSVKKGIMAIDPAVAFKRLLLPSIQSNPSSWLDTGRNVSDTKLRPRELLGLIIMCAVVSHRTGLTWQIGTDHDDGDGTIVLVKEGHKGSGIPLEQVYVNSHNGSGKSLADAALAEVRNKEAKGIQYTADRSLIVLINETGPMAIEELVAGVEGTGFEDVAVIGLLSPNKFEYYCGVVNRKAAVDGYTVIIDKDSGASVVQPSL